MIWGFGDLGIWGFENMNIMKLLFKDIINQFIMVIKILASRDPNWLSNRMFKYGLVIVFNNDNRPQRIDCVDTYGLLYYIFFFRNVENEKEIYVKFANEILSLLTNNFGNIFVEQTPEMEPLLQHLKVKAQQHFQQVVAEQQVLL
jgi:hypothetical protein